MFLASICLEIQWKSLPSEVKLNHWRVPAPAVAVDTKTEAAINQGKLLLSKGGTDKRLQDWNGWLIIIRGKQEMW